MLGKFLFVDIPGGYLVDIWWISGGYLVHIMIYLQLEDFMNPFIFSADPIQLPIQLQVVALSRVRARYLGTAEAHSASPDRLRDLGHEQMAATIKMAIFRMNICNILLNHAFLFV